MRQCLVTQNWRTDRNGRLFESFAGRENNSRAENEFGPLKNGPTLESDLEPAHREVGKDQEVGRGLRRQYFVAWPMRYAMRYKKRPKKSLEKGGLG